MLILTLLRAAPLVVQLALAGSVLAGIGGGYAYWHHEVYQSGVDDTLVLISEQNKEGLDAANKLKAKVFSCAAGNGTWDQSRGVCE